jgi:hypothetical protein
MVGPWLFVTHTTVDVTKDIIATGCVSLIYRGENYYFKCRNGQRWYWLSNPRVDEVLLFHL